jgi:hypothetical protein
LGGAGRQVRARTVVRAILPRGGSLPSSVPTRTILAKLFCSLDIFCLARLEERAAGKSLFPFIPCSLSSFVLCSAMFAFFAFPCCSLLDFSCFSFYLNFNLQFVAELPPTVLQMTDETRIDGEPMNCPKGTIALQSGVSGPTHTIPLTSCTQRRLYGLRTHT